MTQIDPFQLEDFMPYLLNRAAEKASLEFQKTYKSTYGMLRTEWRVLFHLGRYGELTAKQICDKSDLHKTKVSRAVSALEKQRFLMRTEVPTDRRHELLSLTKQGQAAFAHLQAEAVKYNERVMSAFTPEEQDIAMKFMKQIAQLS